MSADRPKDAREILLGRFAEALAKEAGEPIERVLLLCAKWDAITKGESSVTMQIRAAIRGDQSI
jgi:hypothetical protein